MNGQAILSDLDLGGWVSLIGTILSLIGLGFTAYQVVKARKAADAASEAAKQARAVMRGTVLLSDVSKCSSSIDEVKSHVRVARYEGALLRLQDVIAQLVQIRRVGYETQNVDFRKTLTELAIIRGVLERQVTRPEEGFDPYSLLQALSKISDEVNDWVGQFKYIAPGTSHADSR